MVTGYRSAYTDSVYSEQRYEDAQEAFYAGIDELAAKYEGRCPCGHETGPEDHMGFFGYGDACWCCGEPLPDYQYTKRSTG